MHTYVLKGVDDALSNFMIRNQKFNAIHEFKLFMRLEARDVWSWIANDVADNMGLRDYVVTGNPGIGKSISSLFLVRELLLQQENGPDAVGIWYAKDKRGYFFRLVNGRLEAKTFHNVENAPEVSDDRNVLIYDSGLENLSFNFGCSTITVVFCQPGRCNQIMKNKHANIVRIVMNPWKMLELQLAGKKLGKNVLDIETVRECSTFFIFDSVYFPHSVFDLFNFCFGLLFPLLSP